MGIGDKAFGLVSMTNGDVYYLGEMHYYNLRDSMRGATWQLQTFTFTDNKSGDTVTIALDKFSSVVKMGRSDG